MTELAKDSQNQTPPPRTHRDNQAPCQSVGSPRSERLRMDAEGNYNKPMTVKSHHILQMHGPRHTSQAPHFHECTGSMRPRRFQHSPCKKQKAHAVRRQLSLSAGDEPPTVLSTRPGSLSSEQVRFRNLRHTHVINVRAQSLQLPKGILGVVHEKAFAKACPP